MSASSADFDRDDLPKVEKIISSEPLTQPGTLQMLSTFLMEEQDRRQRLREENGLNTTWKDLQNAYDTLVMPAFDEQHLPSDAYDTFSNYGVDNTKLEGGEGSENWSKRLAMAASSTFLGSPDIAAHEDKKVEKERKKKRKDAKKAAKRQAKLQAKMMLGK